MQLKLNRKFIKTVFKSIFCIFYLMLMINCKSGNITSSSTSNNQGYGQVNTKNNALEVPYTQDEESQPRVPNGQDGQSQSSIPNGEDEGSNSKVPNGQDGSGSNENTHQFSLTQPAKQKVDFLMVIDKSLSMQENHKAFLESSRFQNLFSGPLQDIDWQIGFANTYVNSIYHYLAYLEDNNGLITTPKGSNMQVLTQNLTALHYNLNEVFTNTIYKGTQDFNKAYDTEEPLASIINTVQLPENNALFRSEAALVAIIISDEDERSTGGSEATRPSKVIKAIRSNLGQSKQFSAYGIIIQPGDQQCLNAEKAATTVSSESIWTLPQEGKSVWVPPREAEGPPCPKPYRPGYYRVGPTIPGYFTERNYSDNNGGSYGYSTTELANLTNGIIASICNENYNSILSDIEQKFTADRISNKIQLEHTDVIENTISVTFTPSTNAPDWQFNSKDNTITLSTPLAEGTQIQISYSYR